MNSDTNTYLTLFHQACIEGNMQLFHEILNEYPDVILHDLNLILYLATDRNHHEIIRELIRHGIDIRGNDNWILRRASFLGHIDIVREVIQAGSKIDSNNNQALRWSIQVNNFDVVKLLLDYGANLNDVEDEIWNECSSEMLGFIINYLRTHWNLEILPHSKLYNYSESLKYRMKLPLYQLSIDWLYHPDNNFIKQKIQQIEHVLY